MEYKTATLVPLGKGHISKVTGVHESIANTLEERVLAHGHCVYDVYKLMLVSDGRIAIEREDFPLESHEPLCQCVLCKQRRANDNALEEVFADHFEQGEKA